MLSPSGCDVVFSDIFFFLYFGGTYHQRCSKYEVDGFRNVDKFLPFSPSSNPRRQESAEPLVENIGALLIDVYELQRVIN